MHWSLCDLAADVIQNAAESGAAVVEAEIAQTEAEFRFRVRDDGRGMGPEQLARAADPFHTDGIKHPGRRVGLGLAFLDQAARQCGGGWKMDSAPGAGTTVEAWFDLTSLDTPPVGDVPGLLRTALLFRGPAETVLRRTRRGVSGGADYSLRRSELEEALGGLETAAELALLERYLRSLEDADETND
jgi:hypothetical protein